MTANQAACPKFLLAREKHLLAAVFTLVILVLPVLPQGHVLAETAVDRTGTVIVGAANVRTGPTTSDPVISTISGGHAVYVVSSTTGQAVSGYGDTWFLIRCAGTGGSEITGYVVAVFIDLDPLPGPDPEPDAAFEALLDQEGFPESYRPGLRRLHAKYPEWQFSALQTGLDWADAVENLHTPGYSLITASVNDNWKSLDEEAYDYLTDTWKPYDGSTWVMASRDLIAWTMDPRNMMSESLIFQFERLNSQPGVHTEAGVEVILKNSFMGGRSFQVQDPGTGETRTITYAGAFMEAGTLYDISPYHLAARSLIEVGTGGSASVTGLFSAALASAGLPVTYAYDGYYNFYNIGAANSTEPLGNVRNGLEYAKYGPDRKSEQTETDTARLIPWNSRYRAILGGSMIIGAGYISVGQNTLYLQKFDVDNSDGRLYWHIYMSNIQAPVSEGAKLYRAYSEMGDLHKPIAFLLPVYLNMPVSACPKPAESGNPNNWLKTLSAGGTSLTPTFDPQATGPYSLIVEPAVSSVLVTASPVVSTAAVSGTGNRQLAPGQNLVNVTVTAQNGELRTYRIDIFRKYDPNQPSPTPSPTSIPSAPPTAAPSPMPSPTAAPLPSQPATPVPEPAASPSPPVPPEAGEAGESLISSEVLRISGRTITGLDPVNSRNSRENLAGSLTAAEGCALAVVNPDGTPAAGLVGTGAQVIVTRGDGTAENYTVVLYGDVSGDGRINSSDLNILFRHILKSGTVSGACLQAADADHNGKVNSSDLNMVFKAILRQLTISQP